MKKVLVLLLVLLLTVFTFSGCIDPDEALPHYTADVDR